MTPQAREAYYTRWEDNPKRIKHGVVAAMRDHTTKAIYDCSTVTFDWIKQHHKHPLGDLKKSEIKHIVAARDWEPSFAFVHLFHLLLEDIGRPPLWSEFDQFVYGTHRGREMFGDERAECEAKIFNEELARITSKHRRVIDPENRARYLAKGSLDWRIGNAYYGFMREMYTAVALRERGLDVRVHPLADANFRADGWVGNAILSVFVINPRFKMADQQRAEVVQRGRKKHVEELFPGGQFSFAALTMDSAEEHGEFHFPTPAELDKVERQLRGKG
ncbi:hypothetical protein L3Q67_32945 [Saccharothrix sp. AJ9571]|nr:hypothetical protein L3Q67_32945 [Saccharothrix sp. AJ9571]